MPAFAGLSLLALQPEMTVLSAGIPPEDGLGVTEVGRRVLHKPFRQLILFGIGPQDSAISTPKAQSVPSPAPTPGQGCQETWGGGPAGRPELQRWPSCRLCAASCSWTGRQPVNQGSPVTTPAGKGPGGGGVGRGGVCRLESTRPRLAVPRAAWGAGRHPDFDTATPGVWPWAGDLPSLGLRFLPCETEDGGPSLTTP